MDMSGLNFHLPRFKAHLEMIIDRKEYKITWVDYDEELDELNSNLDIHVEFKNGKKYVATFFTIKNIYSLFEKNKTSGECANGTFFGLPIW